MTNFDKEYKVEFGVRSSTTSNEYIVFDSDYDKIGSYISVAKSINRNYTIKKYNTVDGIEYATYEIIDPPLTSQEQKDLWVEEEKSRQKRIKEEREIKRIEDVNIAIDLIMDVLVLQIVELNKFFTRNDILDLDEGV
ncbi:hypothetical protein LCGC14_1421110 [marine sediment metagenome]|uniref:Uncharacterized protein n=1 Tax=marine sediment metagenome TaxID=412755 RepID=A0A0F9JRV3_9ZZZZ